VPGERDVAELGIVTAFMKKATWIAPEARSAAPSRVLVILDALSRRHRLGGDPEQLLQDEPVKQNDVGGRSWGGNFERNLSQNADRSGKAPRGTGSRPHSRRSPSPSSRFLHGAQRVFGRAVPALHRQVGADLRQEPLGREAGQGVDPRCVGRMTIPSSSMLQRNMSTCSYAAAGSHRASPASRRGTPAPSRTGGARRR